ncbi:MAG: hypothetical protein KDC30_06960 [Saprospiraceae bacterium]|nr:hypothetical protein [Saprospiraceae bacterium]
MPLRLLLLTLSAGFLFSCANSTPDPQESLPNSPEAVVRAWQALVDKNQFADAKKLSTRATVEFIDALDLMMEMMGDSSVIHTVLNDLSCRENGDRAVCFYSIDEDGELLRDSTILVRENGQWLVDIQEEVLNLQEEMLMELDEFGPLPTEEEMD